MFQPHIVFFNRSFYPDTAATGQLLTELCETLVEEYGYRVTVVAGLPLSSPQADNNGFHLFNREKYHGIEIIRVRGTRFSKNTFAGRFSNYVSYFLSAIYASQFVSRPHVVVALTDPPIIGLAAFLLRLRYGAPLLMSYRDIFPEVGNLLEDFHSNVIISVLQWVNCFLVRRAARVVALGETARRRLITTKQAAPETAIVIPDWADCNDIVPAAKDNDFRRRHGLAGKFVVLHSGNIGLSQGLESVIQAAAVLQDHLDIEFVFIGEGVKRPHLEALAKELRLQNVRFIPFQPKSDLTLSFATADVFVVSLKKGLAGFIVPSKLYGILAAGRPFVAAVENDSEVAAIADRFKCGLIAEPENPPEIAAQILALYRDPRLRTQMGVQARRAGLLFDRAPQVLAYHRMFSELISAGEHNRIKAVFKRLFDILFAGAGLVASSPLWLAISIAIKLDDGGPIFYGQNRVGRYGRLFKGWKFRSMIIDADQKYGPLQASEHDPRVTHIGRWLRVTAMDELPQLWNIFCGDMSFVGPRALLPQEAEVREPREIIPLDQVPGFFLRTQVRPGLTGIAQVYAPRDIPRRQKFRLDALYVRKQTFGLDIKLILLSFWISFRGKWEYRGAKI